MFVRLNRATHQDQNSNDRPIANTDFPGSCEGMGKGDRLLFFVLRAQSHVYAAETRTGHESGQKSSLSPFPCLEAVVSRLLVHPLADHFLPEVFGQVKHERWHHVFPGI